MAIILRWTRHASSVLEEQHRINFGATSRGEETKGIRSKEKLMEDKKKLLSLVDSVRKK
jgi:hypothetical protein